MTGDATFDPWLIGIPPAACGLPTTTTSTSSTTTSSTSTSTSSSTTTTTLAPPICNSIRTCLVALKRALPKPRAATGQSKRVATKLRARYRVVTGGVLASTAARRAGRKAALNAKAQSRLQALLGFAGDAAADGTLAVPLDPIRDAALALLDQIDAR